LHPWYSVCPIEVIDSMTLKWLRDFWKYGAVPEVSNGTTVTNKNYICDEINETGNVPINVILMRVRVIIVAMEKQDVLHILSVCV
jgi:hypothetical protein